MHLAYQPRSVRPSPPTLRGDTSKDKTVTTFSFKASVDAELSAMDWGNLGFKPACGLMRLRLVRVSEEAVESGSTEMLADEYALVDVADTYTVRQCQTGTSLHAGRVHPFSR